MQRLRNVLFIIAVAVLAAPAIAVAQPGQLEFNQTYPYASRLCATVAAGHLPKELTGDTSQITAACAQLNTSFAEAQNAYTTTVAPLRQQALAAIQQLRQTCQQALQNHDRVTCQQARQQTVATLQGLRAQVKTAAQAYHSAVQAARRTFWSTIRALRAGASVPEDPTVGPGPASPIPGNSAVTNA